MSQPNRALIWMLGFLGLIVAVCVVLARPLVEAFGATPVFNGVILLAFLIGIAVNLRQVNKLQQEVDWIETYRRSSPDRKIGTPVLLAPMAQMLKRSDRRPQSLSTASMRSILDSVHLRLEEQRDLSRYLIGLLIFLGLLGTFWGLLRTIASVSEIIGGLTAGSDAAAMFDVLKERLQAPLSGMATSFSTSLFGLAGSLVLGFLDLQSGRTANRFYTEVENWLSSMTHLSAGGGVAVEGETSVPAYVQALLEQTAESIERMQRSAVESARERRVASEQLGELNTQLTRLSDLISRESRDLSALASSQDDLGGLIRHLAHQPNPNAQFSEELRAELRLMSRTIAAALDKRQDD